MPKTKKETTRKTVDYKKKYSQMTALMLATLKAVATLSPLIKALNLKPFPTEEVVATIRKIHEGVE